MTETPKYQQPEQVLRNAGLSPIDQDEHEMVVVWGHPAETVATATKSIAKYNAEMLTRMIKKLIAKCMAESRNPEPQEMALIQTQAELVYESIDL